MIVIIFIFVAIFFISSPVHAANGNVVINEIYPHPSTGSSEWIELYNNSSNNIDLSNWKIIDLTSSGGESVTTITSGTIEAFRFFVFEFTTAKLNNDGDIVTLKDSSNTVIDSFSYNSSETDRSFARIPDGTGSWTAGQTPTKGASNGTPPSGDETVPPPATGNIVLTEFMPNPDGGNEWAEVFNPQDSEIDIGGWKIDDIEGASSPFPIPAGTKIATRAYLIFSFSGSGKLNNSGDTIRLLNPDGQVVETYSFGETTKGVSFAKDSQGNWQVTNTPTPGTVNKITLPSNPSKATTTKIKNPSDPSLPQTDPINPSSANQPTGNHNLATDSTNSGKVAGVSNEKDRNSNLATLLIAAGLSFLVTAFAWPVIEKYLWKK
ncbi:MAG: hypothetical protein A2Z24_00660 [Candidatus Woykebacteria bacterium RBG_16_44_10]|uniref:LTD domain-containing protein n=1 Tax=Candidatus Woykebacteria bacterium RBG_16_44_10 TaxID=1802597 RepID=A0A1G1WCC1_9BACT|nr:MAG: hypothetical protein A2Z24_00660 [Candidatus Woykebacteria bacterium RBG_16_44_10]